MIGGMGDPASVKLKIARAEKHAADLETEVKTFLFSRPYEVSVMRDSAGKPVYYLSSVKPTPLGLSSITGDAIQNLRSALDHLAFQLFLSGTAGKDGEGRHIYFPIGEDKDGFERSLGGKTGGIQSAAIEAINNIEPFAGGKGHQLWILEQLNNTDKHRSLITVGSALRSVDIGSHLMRSIEKSMAKDKATWGDTKPPEMNLPLVPADRMFPLKVGDILFIGAAGDEFDEKMKFAFDVSLNEPGVVDGRPLIETLQQLIKAVKDVIPFLEPFL